MAGSELDNRLFATLYDRVSRMSERRGGAQHRRELLAGLRGRVIEVGAGNGLNFAHYPETVAEVVAVEPEVSLRARAERAAEQAPVPVRVVAGVADDLPAEDASFDAGVACLVLCSVPDQAPALAELHRVIRPGGQLRFNEHVVARRPLAARLQRTADRLFWVRLNAGCHLARDTGKAIEEAGFEIRSCRRYAYSPLPVQPRMPHILGAAVRP
jgi:ubiquinone/menaquinone biosynthesis C-methylase UbiE